MKQCCRCALTQPFSEFPKSPKNVDGLMGYCYACKRVAAKKYYAENREKVAAQGRAYRQAHSEKIAQANKVKWQKTMAHQKAKSKAYYEANKESIKARVSEWQKQNPDLVRYRYVRRRGRIKASGVYLVSNTEMTRLYSSPCVYCGAKGNIQADHIIPLARGGRHSIGNLAPACETCNKSKQVRTVMEWRLSKRVSA